MRPTGDIVLDFEDEFIPELGLELSFRAEVDIWIDAFGEFDCKCTEILQQRWTGVSFVVPPLLQDWQPHGRYVWLPMLSETPLQAQIKAAIKHHVHMTAHDRCYEAAVDEGYFERETA